MPQPPQLFTSVVVSTHALPHTVSGHVHWLFLHTRPAPHENDVPQPPQLRASLVMSVQNAAPLEPHAI